MLFIKYNIISLKSSYLQQSMNFLNFLTAGGSMFNFNLQSLASSCAFNLTSQADKQNQPIRPSTNQLTFKMKQEMEVLSQQQQIINQYMHLNIQLLSQKLQNLEKSPVIVNKQKLKKPAQEESQQARNSMRKNKKIVKCGHEDKQHYAKGLCNNCYHKFGRNKKPWKCAHEKLYAAGMCQNCYINNYNKKKRTAREFDQKQQALEQAQIQAKREQKVELVVCKNDESSTIRNSS